jgi:hypothetical protein
MRADVKAELIALLRSRRYRQLDRQLRLGDRDRCVLGVVDDLYHEAGEGRIHEGLTLPEAVRTWAGLSPAAVAAIASLNNAGLTFDEVAHLLERTDDLDNLPPPAVAALICRLPRPRPRDAAAVAPRRREPAAV